jgi:hypothetical protein
MQVQLDNWEIFILLSAITGRIKNNDKYKNYVYLDDSDYIYKLDFYELINLTEEQLWEIYYNCK